MYWVRFDLRSCSLCSAARMQSSVQFQVIPDVVQLVADCTSTDESLFFSDYRKILVVYYNAQEG